MNGSVLAPLVRDRRLWLFILVTVLALLLGCWAIPDRAGIVVVSRTGFWLVLVAFALFVHALVQAFAGDLRALRWRSIDWVSVGLIALGSTVLLVHETIGFKILMDEIML